MPDLPVLTLRPGFPRPDDSLLSAFAEVPSGVVCDAQGRRGALSFDIRPVTRCSRFHGVAVVVEAGAADNLAAWASLKVVRPGDVVVIATGRHSGCSVIGDNFAAMARNAGAVAVVTDGVVRDVAGLDDVGIPVFARGLSPNSPWKNGPGSAGLATAVGGVMVHSGDIIVGDIDGVVHVARERAHETARAIAAVRDKEQKMEADWRDGATAPGWLEERLQQADVLWVKD